MNKEKLYNIVIEPIFLNELDGKYPFDYETKTFSRPTTKMTDPVLTDTNEYEASIFFGTEPVEADYRVGRMFFEQPQPDELTERLFQEFSRAMLRPELSSHRINQIINTPGINDMKGNGARDALLFVQIATDKFNEQDIPYDCQFIYMSTSLCGEIEDRIGSIPAYNQFKKYNIIRIPDRYMNGVKAMAINKLAVFQGLDVYTEKTEDGMIIDINSATKVLHPESIFIMKG